jgi:hypothetical protein
LRKPASQGWSTGFSAKGCIARKIIPLDPDPLCCAQCVGSREHSAQLDLHAGLVCKKTQNYNGKPVFMRFLTPKTPRKGSSGYFFAAMMLVGQIARSADRGFSRASQR